MIFCYCDGEFNVIVVEWFGIGIIRGFGDYGGVFYCKGGVGVFKEMVCILEVGCNVVLIVDVFKCLCVVGFGIIMLVWELGWLIMFFVMVISCFICLKNWDCIIINLLFG